MKKASKKEAIQVLKGIAFISPNFIGFFVFTLLPVIASLFLCFTDWNIQKGISGIVFTGLKNITKIFKDVWFIDSLRNNLVFTLVSVPLTMLFALALAIILNKSVFMKGALRVAFFIPYVANIVAVCSVWMMLFQPTYGFVNGFLRSLSVDNPPGWLSSNNWALLTIAILHVWIYTGYNMVIYLAGLQGIPNDVKEAAVIDGANSFQTLRHVTLPLLSPTTFFIIITGVINSFKVFAPVNIMTDGGPGTSTTVLVYHIYISAFRFFEMGYASTIAWVLFLIIFIITYFQWIGQKKWVEYM